MIRLIGVLCLLVLAAACSTAVPKDVLESKADECLSGRLSVSGAKALSDAFTIVRGPVGNNANAYRNAIAILDEQIAKQYLRKPLCSYELATLLQERGTFKTALGNNSGAIADYQNAYKLDAFDDSRNKELKYFISLLRGEKDVEEPVTIDRDAQPLVRIPPAYPQECTQVNNFPVGKKERVVLDFDVSPEGITKNIKIISSDAECLNANSIDAIKKWRYAPKIRDGKAVERTGVRASFIYSLK